MKIRLLLLSSCICMFVGWLHGADADANPKAATIVKSLGPNTRPTDLVALQADPSGAVELLAQQLMPIADKRILAHDQRSHSKEMRVIWSIRALRYLTGLNFSGKTTHKFKGDIEADRAQFLGLTAENEVFFFGTWMSRDSIYVAPRDAQLQIIEKWKDWVSLNAKKHKFTTPKDINDWYP